MGKIRFSALDARRMPLVEYFFTSWNAWRNGRFHVSGVKYIGLATDFDCCVLTTLGVKCCYYRLPLSLHSAYFSACSGTLLNILFCIGGGGVPAIEQCGSYANGGVCC
jgi:hypothetical protein